MYYSKATVIVFAPTFFCFCFLGIFNVIIPDLRSVGGYVITVGIAGVLRAVALFFVFLSVFLSVTKHCVHFLNCFCSLLLF